ncbi:MAG: hypothetical protein MZV70_43320 [Desulfobacterales bacterium]|nr:hypothetical protein [Desulfobacterales bacterium]
MQAALERNEPSITFPLLHVLPGLGNTTMAHIIAAEMNWQQWSPPDPHSNGQPIWWGIPVNLRPGTILFIDEIYRLPRIVRSTLPVYWEDGIDFRIEPGPHAVSVRLELARFTVVGATTRAGLLTGLPGTGSACPPPRVLRG